MAFSLRPPPFTARSASATCSPNGRRSAIATPAFSRSPSEPLCCCSGSGRSLPWCWHDRAAPEPSQERALDGSAAAPAVRPGAGRFPAAALSGARPCHRRRTCARRLPALERATSGKACRKRPRFPASGAYVRGCAAAGDRESRLARRAEAAGDGRRRRVSGDCVHLPRARFLRDPVTLERLETDILILGSGGAGLFAALHAHKAAPDLDIAVASKGLLGKCGCTRMVQGGYNVALNPGDSIKRHFMDTIEGGKWLPHQELAWTLVSTAVERVRELENEIGCFFDRNADGTLHGKAFAGQSFDRTVHKGDLTGIEIINRLMEQVWAQPV